MQQIRTQTRLQCQALGLPWAKASMGSGLDPLTMRFTAEWIEEEERRERDEFVQRQLQLSSDAVQAAFSSASAARDAASASKKSAKWTVIAAIFSAISALASLAQVILSVYKPVEVITQAPAAQRPAPAPTAAPKSASR